MAVGSTEISLIDVVALQYLNQKIREFEGVVTMKIVIIMVCALASAMASAETSKNVYFGDTHLHSSYSFDAFLNNNHSADPDTAYRWAKGQPVIHPYNRARVQIDTPLDFLVVSDHAEMLGVMRAVREGTIIKEDLGWIGNIKRWYCRYW